MPASHETVTNIPVEAPRNPSLRDYFSQLSKHKLVKEPIPENAVKRIETILHRNNTIGDLLQQKEYLKIYEAEKALKGEAKLGAVICFDGRFTTIHPFGKTVNVWEEPAALIEVRNTKGRRRLRSAQFTEALRAAAKDKRDLFEIVFAHTSLTTDHKCGAMMSGEARGKFNHLPKHLTTIEQKNLYLLETNQIPAITDTYNEFRKQNNLPALQQVAISATYDTDTMGVVLNLGSDREFSTTKKIGELRGELEFLIGENLGTFGHMRDTFTEPSHFINFSKNVLDITQVLLKWDKFGGEVEKYINQNYTNLTSDQKQALSFTLARATAAQYVTGLSQIPPGGPNHRFAEHEEGYMSATLDGKAMGRYDVGEQSFGSTASSAKIAKAHIHTKLSLLDSHHQHDVERQPDILFVTKVVDSGLWEQYNTPLGDQTIKRALASQGEFFSELCGDKEIRKRMEEGRLILVPVLVDQQTGKILSVIDDSVYI